MQIRAERDADRAGIHDCNARAFEGDVEARLVDRLRERGSVTLSLVAIEDEAVIGHILFSPVQVAGRRFVALGPMSVVPERQRGGIGSMLVRGGIEACRARGDAAVFVLGHAEYYPRFGFQPAAPRGLHYETAELDPYFFVLELREGALEEVQGWVEYDAAFDEV